MENSTQKDLRSAEIGTEYIVKEIKTEDEDLKSFLFTLGCYEGEMVTVVSILSDNYVVAIKDARYSMDSILAKAIII